MLNKIIWYLLLFCFSSSVMASEQNLPDLNGNFYIAVPVEATTTFSLNASYGSSTGTAPTLVTGDNLFLKMLVPPGVSVVSAGGESGSFTDQFFLSVDSDVSGQTQNNCVSETNCLGKAMQRINGRLSATVYVGSPLTTARYMTLVLRNTASASMPFMTFSITMKIDHMALYKQWRAARPWAGGLATNSIDGIGENIPTFMFSAKSESDSRGSVTCDNTTCPINASANAPMTLQATEKTGFIFSEWQCTGSSPANSKSKSTTITVNTATNCIAVFNTVSSGSSASSVEYALPEFPGLPKADVKLSARVDELPNGGFSWLNLSDDNAITTALKDYGNLPSGSSLTMNAAIAPSDPVNAMDIYAVVWLTGAAGKPDIFKQKVSSKASFDFTNEDDWQTLGALKPYKTVSNAKMFSSLQPYSFIVGAGEVILPKGYSAVMFAVGYQANGTLKATLSKLLPVAGIQYAPLTVGNVYKLPVELTEPSVDNCLLFDDSTNLPITQGISKIQVDIPQSDGTSKTVNRCAITTSNIPSTVSFVRLTYTKVGQTPTFAKYFEIKR